MNDLISIIIPIYNGEKYLKECIESVLRQTYRNFELILINDGSLDNSKQICQEFSSQDARIRFIDKTNEGVSATRNLGLSLAKGEYVTFIDADDFVAETYLEDLYEAIRLKPNSIAICKFARYIENEPKLIEVDEKLVSYQKGQDIYELILKKIFVERSIFGSSCRMLMPLSLIKKEDLNFPLCKIAEDSLFLLSVLSKIESVNVVDESLYFYRIYSESCSHVKYKKNFLKDREIYLQELQERLGDFGLTADQYSQIWSTCFFSTQQSLYFNALFVKGTKEYRKEVKEIDKSIFSRKNKNVEKKHYKLWIKTLSKKDKLIRICVKFRMLWILRIFLKFKYSF